MNDKEIINYWYKYLHKNYPFIEWGFDFKKNSMGAKFTFTATNLVTDTTYSISVAILSIFIEDYQIEYVEQNVKSLVEKIKAESAKKLLNGMGKFESRR